MDGREGNHEGAKYTMVGNGSFQPLMGADESLDGRLWAGLATRPVARHSCARSALDPLPEYRTQLFDGGFQRFGRAMTLTLGVSDFIISRYP